MNSENILRRRKVKPKEWADTFNSRHPFTRLPEVKEPPHKNLRRPGIFDQLIIYLSQGF